MITYRTQSDSIYDVDGDWVRRRVRGAKSDSERVSAEWRKASVRFVAVGLPLTIVWGVGKDEHSDSPKTVKVGEGDFVVRTTVTSPVVGVDEPECLPSSH